MITIVLADDHHIVRQAMRALLETVPDFKLVGEAGDGLEAVRTVERLTPGVLVCDLMMPALNGLEVARQVAQRTRTRVLILSMHSNDAYVSEALSNGAAGYVLKDCQSSELIHAIREIAAGRRYLSPQISERAIELYGRKFGNMPEDPYQTLTTREREVLQLAAEGRTNAQISERLFISPRTIETHRANLMRKLGLQNHGELIRYAVKRGIISLDG
ncbi:MAG: response regulator transcription factor [Acidobacteria bacterium]|nr:response regulator transcription factor [Acidobacteriota bacterium]MCW5970899.1 response regulator transcription factor [Blastocatellales bacterium]